jgi:hypothetical protein
MIAAAYRPPVVEHLPQLPGGSVGAPVLYSTLLPARLWRSATCTV